MIGPAFGYGYQGGKVVVEMLRLNVGIAPTGPDGQGTSPLGLLGGDLAGFPNGRRVTDEVVTIELEPGPTRRRSPAIREVGPVGPTDARRDNQWWPGRRAE